jgi:hypothetical protein
MLVNMNVSYMSVSDEKQSTHVSNKVFNVNVIALVENHIAAHYAAANFGIEITFSTSAFGARHGAFGI